MAGLELCTIGRCLVTTYQFLAQQLFCPKALNIFCNFDIKESLELELPSDQWIWYPYNGWVTADRLQEDDEVVSICAKRFAVISVHHHSAQAKCQDKYGLALEIPELHNYYTASRSDSLLGFLLVHNPMPAALSRHFAKGLSDWTTFQKTYKGKEEMWRGEGGAHGWIPTSVATKVLDNWGVEVSEDNLKCFHDHWTSPTSGLGFTNLLSNRFGFHPQKHRRLLVEFLY